MGQERLVRVYDIGMPEAKMEISAYGYFRRRRNDMAQKILAFATGVCGAAFALGLAGVPRMAAATLIRGERFAPVSVAAGQGLRVVVANVRIPGSGESTAACPTVVQFFDSTGALIGAEQDFPLAPGASMSITGAGAAGLVRVIVSASELTDSNGLCALKSNVELFDSSSGKTLILQEASPV